MTAEPILEIVYTSNNCPGYFRKKRGKGFYYLAEDGSKLTDTETLQRIDALVIPPNWENVWICSLPNGHIQAHGRDEKGRKQYIYHTEYRKSRQSEKFGRMVEFAHLLPTIRAVTDQHLNQRQWTKEKMLALVVQILDECPMRIGNAYYRDTNNTFGLTTLRRKHLGFDKDTVIFSFVGKSNKAHVKQLQNKKLAKLIRQSSELPGHELFRYYDVDGKMHTLTSQDVNAYLYEITGAHMSSKNFRTWGGTSLAVYYYPIVLEELAESKSRGKVLNQVIKKVANSLGNTTTVCREYYIHPNVLQAIEKETLPNWKEKSNIPKNIAPPTIQNALKDYELLTLAVLQETNEL